MFIKTLTALITVFSIADDQRPQQVNWEGVTLAIFGADESIYAEQPSTPFLLRLELPRGTPELGNLTILNLPRAAFAIDDQRRLTSRLRARGEQNTDFSFPPLLVLVYDTAAALPKAVQVTRETLDAFPAAPAYVEVLVSNRYLRAAPLQLEAYFVVNDTVVATSGPFVCPKRPSK